MSSAFAFDTKTELWRGDGDILMSTSVNRRKWGFIFFPKDDTLDYIYTFPIDYSYDSFLYSSAGFYYFILAGSCFIKKRSYF